MKQAAHLAGRLRRDYTAPAAAFVYVAAFLAYGAVPPLGRLAWITVAAAGARTCAWAIQRIVDADARRLRPIPRDGPADPSQRAGQGLALVLAVGGALALLVAAGQLNRLSLWLSPLPVAAFVVYPYARRGSRAGHFFVGFAHAMGPAGGWVAIRGELEGPAWLLAGAVGLWIAGLEVLDGQAPPDGGARPAVTQPFPHGEAAAIGTAMRAHLGAAALWIGAGWATGRAWWYFAGLALAAWLVATRYPAVASGPAVPRPPQQLLASTGPVSLILLAATLADLVAYP